VEWEEISARLYEPAFLGQSVLELVAVVLSLVNVALTVRQNIWCWPVGIVATGLFIVVFHHAKLYADFGLYIFFFLQQFYGWYHWFYGGERKNDLPVRWTRPSHLAWLLALGAVSAAGFGYSLATYTQASFPYWDSVIAAFSVVAQFMLAWKLIENWLIWVAVDVLGVAVYWAKGLKPTAVLYAIFLVLATIGFFQWRQSMRARA
jgi:nicotinamide mononucleotide transporter